MSLRSGILTRIRNIETAKRPLLTRPASTGPTQESQSIEHDSKQRPTQGPQGSHSTEDTTPPPSHSPLFGQVEEPKLPKRGITPDKYTSDHNYRPTLRKALPLLNAYRKSRKDGQPRPKPKPIQAWPPRPTSHLDLGPELNLTRRLNELEADGNLGDAIAELTAYETSGGRLNASHMEQVFGLITSSASHYAAWGPVVLNLVRYTILHNLVLTAVTVKRLRWFTRNYFDPFFVRAVHDLMMSDVFVKNHPHSINPVTLQSDLVRHLLTTGEYELAFLIYKQVLLTRTPDFMLLRALPVERLLDRVLTSLGDSAAAKEVCLDMMSAKVTINLTIWQQLLAVSVQNKDFDTARFAWIHVVDRLPIMTDGALNDVLAMACDHGEIEWMQAILRELVRRGNVVLSSAMASRIIDGFAVGGDLDEILNAMSTIYSVQPNISIRSLAATRQLIGSLQFSADAIFNAFMAHFAQHQPDDRYKTLLTNICLDSIRSQWSSSGLFYLYRKFVRGGDFRPDTTTFELLAAGAFRMGGAKKLGYAIYSELIDQHKVFPSREVMEALIRASLTGTRQDVALFYLAEMIRRDIPIRRHMVALLKSRLHDTEDYDRMTDLLKDHSQESHYQFPTDDVLYNTTLLHRSRNYDYRYSRDRAMAQDFTNGWKQEHVKRQNQEKWDQ